MGFFLLRLFENNRNATASSSVLIVGLTLLTFREREREERSRLCSSRVFRFFVFAIYIVNVERSEDTEKKSLRIVGLNYSLEKKGKGRKKKGKSCLCYRFYIDEPNYLLRHSFATMRENKCIVSVIRRRKRE
jgi:hypothetical protein